MVLHSVLPHSRTAGPFTASIVKETSFKMLGTCMLTEP